MKGFSRDIKISKIMRCYCRLIDISRDWYLDEMLDYKEGEMLWLFL